MLSTSIYERWPPSSRCGAVRSRLKMEEAGGVMDCNDMDLFTNESAYDSIGAMDYFAHSGIIDFWNDTPGLG